MLKYSLTWNLLTDGAGNYTAKAQSSGSYDKEAIITDMLRRGSLLTRTDILAVLNGFEESITKIINDGGTVNTPLF
ncbi:MAG TPA: DNA-binding domain-containing protein, partial [Prolixibacteraceae bacterium]|nr:DNA-binding domain-containing protein [Prolixibacteraceae bacterium]